MKRQFTVTFAQSQIICHCKNDSPCIHLTIKVTYPVLWVDEVTVKLCFLCFDRFKLDEQARYMERTRGVEVREGRVQGEFTQPFT